ncbi:flavodoxin family protein [Candidatus Poribacteria bacterium]
MRVLGIVGSPRRERGLTDALVQSALRGAEDAGAETETMYLADRDPKPCVHCGGGCFGSAVCKMEPDATARSQEVYESDAIILGAPVYIWQINGLTAAFIDKLRLKDCRPPSRTSNARPALGISVAGGTGTGLISAAQSIYLWGFYAIDPLPVSRHNFDKALEAAHKNGMELAQLCDEKRAFDNIGDCLAYYESLSFLDFDTADEFLYLSQLMTNNTEVNADNREIHTEARKNQEAAKALIDQGNKQKAAVHAAKAYELARKAYGD